MGVGREVVRRETDVKRGRGKRGRGGKRDDGGRKILRREKMSDGGRENKKRSIGIR